jgi:hypothetical protein
MVCSHRRRDISIGKEALSRHAIAWYAAFSPISRPEDDVKLEALLLEIAQAKQELLDLDMASP